MNADERCERSPVDFAVMTDDELSALAGNCIYTLNQTGFNHGEAWDRLADAYVHIQHRRLRKTPLHALGYRVGIHDPLPPERRRAILSFAFEYPLPDVDTNMDDWGDPLSERRRQQIARTILRLIERNSCDPGHERACAEWSSDRNFVLSEALISRELPAKS